MTRSRVRVSGDIESKLMMTLPKEGGRPIVMARILSWSVTMMLALSIRNARPWIYPIQACIVCESDFLAVRNFRQSERLVANPAAQ